MITTGKITEINVSEIDWNNCFFRFGRRDNRDALAVSIKQYGILQAPIVLKGKAGYQIFAGFNRLEVSKNIQNSFGVIIIDQVTTDLLKREAAAKLYGDRVGASGKIRLCGIYRDFLGQGSEELKKTAKSIGGLPADFFPGMENFNKLMSLEGKVRDFIDEKDISFKVLRNFLSLGSAVRATVLPLVEEWNPGKNNFRKLIDILLDLEQQGDSESLARQLESISNREDGKTFEGCYRILSALRYPAYSEMIAERDRLLKLSNVPSVNFIVPEFFEGDEIILQAKIKRNDNPEDVLKKISGLDQDVIAGLQGLL